MLVVRCSCEVMSGKIALFTVPGEKVRGRGFFPRFTAVQDHPATPGLITFSRTRLVVLLLLVRRWTRAREKS